MTLKSRFDRGIHFFLITVMLGQAIGYGKLYVFHLALLYILFIYVYALGRNIDLQIQKRKTFFLGFFKIMFLWYFTSIFWSYNIFYSFRYVGYIILGISIVYFTYKWCSTIEKFQTAFKIIQVVFLIQLFVCILEIFTPFRFPTSPYSPYAAFFGKKASDLTGFTMASKIFISTVPTGFLGNPNNLAIVIVTGFPFLWFTKRSLKKVFISLLLLIVAIYSGSRGALIGLILGYIFYLFIAKRKIFFLLVPFCILFSSIFISNLDLLRQSDNVRVADIANLGQTVVEYFSQEQSTGGSISERRQLIRNGMEALWASNGIGVGGGGALAVQEKYGGVGDLESMHNFWIEILVESGVLFFLAFVTWYIILTYQMFKIFKTNSNFIIRQYAGAVCVALVVFSVSCISASSVIYLLQMWLLFGFAIALYTISKSSKVNNEDINFIRS